ncbi:MAG: Hsp70 family protein [Actinomycetota bacterium]
MPATPIGGGRVSANAAWTLAIDFGTTTTVAASRADGGTAQVIEIDGDRRVPSIVFVDETEGVLVGKRAEHLAATDPSRTVRAPKTRIGDTSPVVVAGTTHDPLDLIAAILRHVVDEAIRFHGGTRPSSVRLTHPASWSGPRRSRLLEAARRAGVDDAVLVPEPVAAAIGHAADRGTDPAGAERPVLVYDLGGGTLDTAALKAVDPGFELLGRPGGDQQLGGELFDELLVADIGSELDDRVWERLQVDDDPLWRQAAAGLRREAKRAKEALSTHAFADVVLGLPTGMVQQRVERERFDRVIGPYVDESVSVLRQTASGAGLGDGDIDTIHLVGGASRTPLIEASLRSGFDAVDISRLGDPKGVVALGATHPDAVQGGAGPAATMLDRSPTTVVDSALAPPLAAGGLPAPGADEAASPPASKASGPSRNVLIGAAAAAVIGVGAIGFALASGNGGGDAAPTVTTIATIGAPGDGDGDDGEAADAAAEIGADTSGSTDVDDGPQRNDVITVPTAPPTSAPAVTEPPTTQPPASAPSETTPSETTPSGVEARVPTNDELASALVPSGLIASDYAPIEIEPGADFCSGNDESAVVDRAEQAFQRSVDIGIEEQLAHEVMAFPDAAAAAAWFDRAFEVLGNCDRSTYETEGFVYDMLIQIQPFTAEVLATVPCADDTAVTIVSLFDGPALVPAVTQTTQAVRCGSNVSTVTFAVTQGIDYLVNEENLVDYVTAGSAAQLALANIPTVR